MSKPKPARRTREGSPALARNLTRLRLAHSMTQQQLADAARVSLRTYAYYEEGRMPPLDVGARIAQVLGVTADALLSEQDGK